MTEAEKAASLIEMFMVPCSDVDPGGTDEYYFPSARRCAAIHCDQMIAYIKEAFYGSAGNCKTATRYWERVKEIVESTIKR